MEKVLLHLLNTFEEIGVSQAELYDTDVKEQTSERFVQLFFLGDTKSLGAAEYGMFSALGNQAIQSAFEVFASHLAKSDEFAAADDVAKWRIFNSVVTHHGQLAVHFFGALTPDNIRPAVGPRGRHRLQATPVYISFIVMPAVVVFLVVFLAFPNLLDGPIKTLALVAMVAFASLFVGDYSYQYLANRTYRKHHGHSA
jgi:hypothetical protein